VRPRVQAPVCQKQERGKQTNKQKNPTVRPCLKNKTKQNDQPGFKIKRKKKCSVTGSVVFPPKIHIYKSLPLVLI
jgi:hypothetical protein